MSKRIRMYTAEDVAEHASASSCWVSYKGRVFDVTRFLPDHPGGDELVLKFAGRDVEDAMRDATEHEHSESAYEVLNEFFIGRVGVGENLVSDDWVPEDDFHPENTDEAKDYEKNQFLDLRKPLLKQMWEANFRCVGVVLRLAVQQHVDTRPVNHTTSSKCISLVIFQSLCVSSVLVTSRYAFSITP